MVYKGHVRNGIILLEGRQAPPEGAEVSVRVVKPVKRRRTSAQTTPTLYERLKNVVGKASNLPPDASRNVEHYLYGAPKRK